MGELEDPDGGSDVLGVHVAVRGQRCGDGGGFVAELGLFGGEGFLVDRPGEVGVQEPFLHRLDFGSSFLECQPLLALDLAGIPKSSLERLVESTHELGDVIRRVLKKSDRPTTLSMARVESRVREFSGGELQIGKNEARLLSVPIASRGGTGYCLDILGRLAKRGADGRYLSRSAEELAGQFDILGGQTAVAGYVRTIRSNITNRLRRDLALECRRDDVIERTTSGYRLREWITTKYAESETPAAVAPKPPIVGLNARQSWFVNQLALGKPVDRSMIEKKFGIHEKTAKRDLTDLTRRRLIEYVRDGQGGHYRLVTSRISA